MPRTHPITTIEKKTCTTRGPIKIPRILLENSSNELWFEPAGGWATQLENVTSIYFPQVGVKI